MQVVVVSSMEAKWRAVEAESWERAALYSP